MSNKVVLKLAFVVCLLTCCSPVAGQVEFPQVPAPPGTWQPNSPKSALMSLVANPVVWQELDTVSNQSNQIIQATWALDQEIQQRRQQVIHSEVSRVRAKAPHGAEAEITPALLTSPFVIDGLSELEKEFESRFLDILSGVMLPHQISRFNELRGQAELGLLAIENVELGYLQNALKFSGENEKEIRSKFIQFERDLDREVRELQFNRRKQFLKSQLSDEQAAKLDAVLGEIWVPEQRDAVKAVAKPLRIDR